MKNIYTSAFMLMLLFLTGNAFAQNTSNESEKPLDYKSILTIVDLSNTVDDGKSDPLVSQESDQVQTIEGREVAVDLNGIQSLAVPSTAKKQENPEEINNKSPRK